MVPVYPSQVGVESRLIIVCHWRESERHAGVGDAGESAAAAPSSSVGAIHACHIGEEVACSEGNAIRKQCLLIVGGSGLRIGRVQITGAEMQKQSWRERRIQVEANGLRQRVLRLQGGIGF